MTPILQNITPLLQHHARQQITAWLEGEQAISGTVDDEIIEWISRQGIEWDGLLVEDQDALRDAYLEAVKAEAAKRLSLPVSVASAASGVIPQASVAEVVKTAENGMKDYPSYTCKCHGCGHVHKWESRTSRTGSTYCPKCGEVEFTQGFFPLTGGTSVPTGGHADNGDSKAVASKNEPQAGIFCSQCGYLKDHPYHSFSHVFSPASPVESPSDKELLTNGDPGPAGYGWRLLDEGEPLKEGDGFIHPSNRGRWIDYACRPDIFRGSGKEHAHTWPWRRRVEASTTSQKGGQES